ncbi:MAG: glycosyltransferase [Candidatus Symbiothrix sp.]|jgi:glycosyltransferase involved in cell wall biosynthesis|nr:glycosyltransferase [Candidatus Symbiothrix sp.]
MKGQKNSSKTTPKIAIVCVTNDLVTDQRVNKTCLALQKAGYEVIETGRLLANSLPINDRPYRTRRIKLCFNKGPLFYAEYNLRLFFYLLFAESDLIYANDLDTLLAAFWAAKLRKKKLIYDSHEYFTEVPELVSRPKTQRIWQKIEKFVFPKLDKIITVNQSIAKLYADQYHKEVQVVRNIPPTFIPERTKTRKELDLPEDKHILIIQGTGINIDRGAEEACLAMKYLKNCILLIIGSGDVFPTLERMIAENQLQDKILIKPKMPVAELRQYTLNSDLGLAIDKNTNLNYLYSLPNKLFDYIHSEIPVLSSNLVEIKQIIDHYNIGYFIENHDPQHIATTIKSIFADQARYNTVKQNTHQAKKELAWENEEKTLLQIIAGVFHTTPLQQKLRKNNEE